MFQQQRNIWNFGRPSIKVRKDPYPLMQFSARCPRAWLDPLFWATPRHPPCFQVFWTFAHPSNFELLRPKLFVLHLRLGPCPTTKPWRRRHSSAWGQCCWWRGARKIFSGIIEISKSGWLWRHTFWGWNVLLPRARVRVRQGAQQGTRWSQRPASREETFPHLPWCVFFDHLSGRVALSFNVRRPVVPPWWHFLPLLLLFLFSSSVSFFVTPINPVAPLTHLSCFCCYFFFIIQFWWGQFYVGLVKCPTR